jgi:hypothetical protein
VKPSMANVDRTRSIRLSSATLQTSKPCWRRW